MLSYTHLTRVNTAPKGSAKVFKRILTPNVSIPTTMDDVRGMLDRPEWLKPVDMVLNEQGTESEKQKLTVPTLVKLIIDSIKLDTNAKAKSGEGVDFLKLASDVLADPDQIDEQPAIIAAMRSGKAGLKAWGEGFLARQEPDDDGGDDGLEGDGK